MAPSKKILSSVDQNKFETIRKDCFFNSYLVSPNDGKNKLTLQKF